MSGLGYVASCCEHGDEPLGSIEFKDFFCLSETPRAYKRGICSMELDLFVCLLLQTFSSLQIMSWIIVCQGPKSKKESEILRLQFQLNSHQYLNEQYCSVLSELLRQRLRVCTVLSYLLYLATLSVGGMMGRIMIGCTGNRSWCC